MVKAFKQHLLMWLILAIAAGAAVAALTVWVDEPASPEEPGDTTDQADRAIPPDIELMYLAGGLAAPADIASTGQAGDGRLFIVEQTGRIRVIENGQLAQAPFLDITDRVLFGGEQGLLGLVFDPKFSSNGYFYVNYVQPAAGGGQTVVARFSVDGRSGKVQADSQKIILQINQPFSNHNGGDLNFGPDGYLYISLGDGGSAGDPGNRAQDPGSRLGKILRINVDSQAAYGVPADNPFVNRDGYQPEIWSWGWRNPWRFSFDALTGDMWIGDVGQGQIEEINHEPAGKSGRNYGWRCWEGAQPYKSGGCSEDKSHYTFPVAQYEHEGGACGGSVTGGYVYRGTAQPALDGYYFYADYCQGRIYSLDSGQATFTAHLIKATELKITTFGVDNSGELYLADAASGTIYQITGQE